MSHLPSIHDDRIVVVPCRGKARIQTVNIAGPYGTISRCCSWSWDDVYANKKGKNGKQAAEAAASHALCVCNWVRETAEEEKKGSRRLLSQASYINGICLYLMIRGKVYSCIGIFFLPAPTLLWISFFFFSFLGVTLLDLTFIMKCNTKFVAAKHLSRSNTNCLLIVRIDASFVCVRWTQNN